MSDIEEVRAARAQFAVEIASWPPEAHNNNRIPGTSILLGSLRAALAALDALEAGGAEGWQLVPVEPTEAMLGSFTGFVKTRLSKATATWVYQAMLARAPHPPGHPEKE